MIILFSKKKETKVTLISTRILKWHLMCFFALQPNYKSLIQYIISSLKYLMYEYFSTKKLHQTFKIKGRLYNHEILL